ncbi:hypothetical protein [Caballeronia sp. TF1N1]|uniref:hypothetical protein n=2 Tax=unclassified Caballeronia TaxID=2646786 RepID=UPI001FD4A5DD|nr:hypothetical protein [Caballeronia sp. TF1N1]
MNDSQERFEKEFGVIEAHPIAWAAWIIAEKQALERAAQMCDDNAAALESVPSTATAALALVCTARDIRELVLDDAHTGQEKSDEDSRS